MAVNELKQFKGVTYDRYGRMNYHPELHPNHKKPWTNKEQEYLIENYERIGPEDTSLGLGRTIHTVMTRVYELRKSGVMPKPKKRTIHHRLRLDLQE